MRLLLVEANISHLSSPHYCKNRNQVGPTIDHSPLGTFIDKINLYLSHDGEIYSVTAAKWKVQHCNKKAYENKNQKQLCQVE